MLNIFFTYSRLLEICPFRDREREREREGDGYKFLYSDLKFNIT
jgi:hypothetical protein